MMRTAEARTRKASEALVTDLEELVQSASDMLDNLSDQRGEAVEKLRTRATRNIESARRRLADLKPQVQQRATDAARAATGFARRNPWSAAAIGALVIASVGALVYASLSDD